jgi:hypothetical protein
VTNVSRLPPVRACAGRTSGMSDENVWPAKTSVPEGFTARARPRSLRVPP